MNSVQPAAELPRLPEGRFTGRSEFADMIRLAFATAAAQGWREIVVSDPDFEDWPLGERAVVQSLNDWSRAGRTFIMLAKTYESVPRRQARFVTWRQTWSHLIECRRCAAADSMPSALWGPGWMFERLDGLNCTGVAGSGAVQRVALRERLDERLLNSSPAFSATTLGL